MNMVVNIGVADAREVFLEKLRGRIKSRVKYGVCVQRFSAFLVRVGKRHGFRVESVSPSETHASLSVRIRFDGEPQERQLWFSFKKTAVP